MRGYRTLALIALTCLQWAWANEKSTLLGRRGENVVHKIGGLPHIVGGVEVDPHSHPHQVALEVVDGGDVNSLCSGSLIADNWVITAAHCVDARHLQHMGVRAVFGAHKYGMEENTTQTLQVEKIVLHPEWNKRAIKNDIALLKLNRSVRIDGKFVDVIKLPRVSQNNWSFWLYQATMTGWGKEKDEAIHDPDEPELAYSVLRSTTSRVITNFVCGIYYYFLSITIRSDHICTSGWWAKGTCQGDSGGPLTIQDSDGQRILIGITSFGNLKCEASWPSVFTRVTLYLDWIHNTTGLALRP